MILSLLVKKIKITLFSGLSSFSLQAKQLAIVLALVALNLVSWGQAVGDYRTRASGNWTQLDRWERLNSLPNNWAQPTAGQGYPGQNAVPNIVTIRNNHAIVLNTSPTNAIGSLTIEGGTENSDITFTGTNSLTVNNATTITSTSNNDYKRIFVNAGTFTTGSLSLNSNNTSNRDAYIEISTGDVYVLNNVTMNNVSTTTYIRFTDNGTLYVGGNMTGGGITSNAGGGAAAPTSGTVNYNGSGNQDIGVYTYYNLTASNAGTKTLAGAITVRNLAIEGSAILASDIYNITGNAAGTFKMDAGTGLTLGNTGSATATTFPSAFIKANTTLNNTSTVTYQSTGAQTISNVPTYGNLTVTTSGTKTLAGAITINNNLDISGSAVLATAQYQITGNASGALTMASGTGLTLGLTSNATNVLFPTSFTNTNITLDQNSTVTYQTNGAQTVSNIPHYGGLTISGGNTKTLNGSTRINGVLNLSNGILALGTNDLTLSSGASTAGTFSATSMIDIGTGSVIKEGNANTDFILTFPIGRGAAYTPFQIGNFSATTIAPSSTIKIQSSATPVAGVPGTHPLNRQWITSTTGISGSVLADARFTYVAGDIPTGGTAGLYEIVYKPTATGLWSIPGGASAAGVNPLRASAATTLDATWTGTEPEKRIFYSLKTGSWDDPTTWTLDPSGTQPLNPNNVTPTTSLTSFFDEVVVLSGRTVTVPTPSKNNKKLTVIGTLDLGTTTGHSFATINGTGRIRLAADNFPSGDATDFITAGQGEGTVEYYGATRDLNIARTFYNVEINATTGNTITLLKDYTISGDLTVTNGTFQINNATATTPLTINVLGNISIATTGKIATGTANARHQLNVYGDFTNSGDARFTNRTVADYANEATDGIVDINFLNSEKNQSITCRGITNFYRIKIDKGTDYTYTLNIEATSPAYFNLFGYANQDHASDTPQLTDNNNALGLVRGSVKIGNSIVIPTLSTANVYSISQGAQLWIDRGTVQKNSGSNIAVYGKLRITNGLLEAKTASGITFRKNGILSVEGGTVNANQIRTSDVGTNNYGGYVQTAGIVNVLGGTTNTDYYVFSLTYPNSVFNMSGGTLNVNTSAGNGGILINSDPENVKVTGGMVNAETKLTEDFLITSTAPFWNLSFKNSTAVARQFTLGAAANIGPDNVNVAAQPLKVLNDFRIWGKESGGASYPAITFTTGTNDVYIGGSFYIENGATYVPINGGTAPYDTEATKPTSRNTTYFNKTTGSGAVEVFYQGDPVNPVEIGNLVVDRGNGYEVKITSGATRVNETVAIDVNGNASVLTGTLNQNLYTIRTWGAITNNDHMGTWFPGVTPSRAQIQIVENPSLTLTTTTNAVFGNVQINVTPPSRLTLTSNVYIERMEYVKGLIYLKSYNLKVDNLWNMETGIFENSTANSYLKILDSGHSGNSMIFTDGKASDGGLTLKITANSQAENQPNILNNFGPITFPLGFTMGGMLYFRPAQMVVKNFTDEGYVTIRPASGPLATLNSAGGEVLQQFWRVSSDNFTTPPTVAFRFYYRNRTGGGVTDLITANSVNEVNYVPGKVQDVSPYTRLYEPLTDNDIIKNIGATNTRVITFNGTSTTGLFTPASSGFTLENSNFTAGAAACFAGSPTHYYSNASYGEWNEAATWDVGFKGSGVHAVPTTGSIVHIYNTRTTANNLPPQEGRISVDASGIPNSPAEIIFELPNLPPEASNSENIPRLQFWRNGTYNLGFVRGIGMISFGNTAVITNGDFGDFGTNPYSYYLFFGGAPQLTTIPTPIPNMMIEYSTDINQKIDINYDLVLQGDAVVHPLQDVQIKRDLVLGFWRGGTFQFPASGSEVEVTVGRDIDFTRVPNPGEIGNRRLNVSTTAGLLEHKLILKRSIIHGSDNNFGIDLYGAANRSKVILEFQGADNGTYSRTSTSVPIFYRMVMNKGINQTPTFSFNNSFTLNGSTNTATKAITMANGTLIFNNAAINVNLTTGGSHFDIPGNSCLNILQGTARANGTSGITLDGKLLISGGTLDMSGGDNPIEYSASGNATISVTGGGLTIGGQVRRSPTSDVGVLKYAQSGGTVVVGQNAATVNNRGVFEILNTGSSFTMSGGDLFIARAQTSPEISAFYFNPATYSIGLAANINIGHSTTPAGQTMGIYAGKPLPKLRVNNTSTRNPIAKLDVIAATITSQLLIDGGATFNANGIDLTLKGDMTASGTFIPNGNTTYLSGTATQNITGNGTALNFYNLEKTTSNTVTLNAANTPLLVLNTLSLNSGTFTDNGNTVTVKGDVFNSATHINSGSGDGIVLNGTSAQTLSGNGTFGKLTINNLAGVNIPVGNQFLITRSLKMQSGVFNIGKNLLDIGVNAVIEEASPFSKHNMITTNISFTDNGLRKTFRAGASPIFTFPVGSSDKYTPVTITISANGNSSGSITVKPANEIHPSIIEDTETGVQIVDKDNALQYYWTLKTSGINGFSAVTKMRYIEDDAKVTSPYTIADYHTASLLSDGLGNWLKFPKTDFDATNKDLIFNFSGKGDAEISGDYTAGAGDASLDGAIPNTVAIYETNTNGDWITGTIWTPNVAGGPRGVIAKINTGHTVDVTTNNRAGYMTEIFGTLKLYSTFGHRLGILNGTGTLYVEIGDIPAAVYDDFFSSAGGTIEFGGTTNYEFLGNITEVNNLKLSRTGERRFPNNNLLLNGSLTISGGAGLKAINYYNRKISIKGDLTRTTGNFMAGIGANATIAMIGTLNQTITGSFSNSNAFNNLEINNANDVDIINDVEINRQLKLTNGLINITPGSLFRLNYGATVSPVEGLASSFVNGVLTKEMMNGNSFTFPIGNYSDTKAHGPITLQNVTGPSGINDWKASYFFANATLAGYSTENFESPISTVSHSEYWKVEAPTGGASIISITLDGSSDVASSLTNLSDLRVVGWNSTSSKWEVVGLGANVVGDATSGTITTTSPVNYGSYSHFTLASVTPVAASTATITSPGVVNLCNGSSTTIVVTFTGDMPYVLTYNVGATPVTTGAINSSSYNITVSPSTTTAYTLVAVTANGVSGTITGITSTTVNVSPIPTVVVSSNDADNIICQGTSITFTATAGLSNYRFRVNGTTVQNSANNTYTTTTLAVGAQSVDVIGTNAGGCSATSSAIAVTVNPLPSAAGAISGAASVCRASTSTYTVPAIANATSYVWTKTNGATGTSTTNSITLTFPTAGTSVITVYGTNGCGNGASSTFSVAVNTASTPGAAGGISGEGEVCEGGTNYTYKVGAVVNATSYIWKYSGTGVTINGTSNNVTIDFLPGATSGNLTVEGENGCSPGIPSPNFPIIVNPSPTATISPATSTVCSNSSVELIASPSGGSGTYTHAWTGDGTFTPADAATTSYSNNVGDPLYILTYTVTDTKGCTGTATTTVTVAQAPVAYAGPDALNLCTGTSPIAMTGATASGSYSGTPTWTGLGGTWTQNPSPALATFTPSNVSGVTTATLTLTGANGCANAIDTRELSWSKEPNQPGAFTEGSASVCQGQSGVTYTVPNDPFVITYNWTYTIGSGATISGTGNSITIDFSALATSGKLNVTATNACGTSIARSLDIVVGTSPAVSIISGNTTTCAGTLGDGFSVTNNATWTYLWSIEDAVGIVQAPGNTSSVLVDWKINTDITWPVLTPTLVAKKVSVVVNTTPAGCPITLEWDVNIHRVPETGPPFHIPNTFGE